MKFQTSNEPLSMFNFASLTDIVMLLVIFFLLTSQFVMQTGVKVKLPGSKTNEQTSPTRLIVTITSAGAIYAGDTEVSIEELPSRLEQVKVSGKQEDLVIRADKTVAVELVIKVIDAAKTSGIEKFTIETEMERL